MATSSGQVEIELCVEQASWDAYVSEASAASTYHRWAWRQVIERTFGHRCYYLLARQDGRICGILPLVRLQSLVFGHFLTSLPCFNYGGVVADSEEARRELLAHASQLGADLKVRHIELRQGQETGIGWQHAAAKVAMVVPLPPSNDELAARLSSRLRNKIKHARKHGFECRWGGPDLADQFYDVFAVNMRNLGTPVYPRTWFKNVCRYLPGDTCILMILDSGEPVAGTVLSWFRDTLELPWIASVPEGRKHYSTVLLYWTALTWAIEKGYKRVDLGRCTPGSGTYQFKQQWSCEELPLHWYYWLAPRTPIPNLRPDNARYALAIRLWQKLPLWAANRLGPWIVRGLP